MRRRVTRSARLQFRNRCDDVAWLPSPTEPLQLPAPSSCGSHSCFLLPALLFALFLPKNLPSQSSIPLAALRLERCVLPSTGALPVHHPAR